MKLPLFPFPELETERLVLRQPTDQDVAEVFFIRTDPEINRYIDRPQPTNESDALAFIQMVQDKLANDKLCYWGIRLKASPKMIGSISLWHFSDDGMTAEVGYDLHPDYHGKGVMSEALGCVVQFGVEILGLSSIEAFTHHENRASRTLLQRHGFILRQHRTDPNNQHNLIYSIRKKVQNKLKDSF